MSNGVQDTTPPDYTGSTDPQTALATLKGRLARGESHCSEEKELRWLIAEYESLRERILINDDRHRDLEAQLRRERDEARKSALEGAISVCDSFISSYHPDDWVDGVRTVRSVFVERLVAPSTAAQPAQEQK